MYLFNAREMFFKHACIAFLSDIGFLKKRKYDTKYINTKKIFRPGTHVPVYR